MAKFKFDKRKLFRRPVIAALVGLIVLIMGAFGIEFGDEGEQKTIVDFILLFLALLGG